MAYLITTLAVVTVALIRAALVTALLPWLLFIPVVLATSLAFGTRPAVWGLFLSTVLAAVSIYVPGSPLILTNAQWGASAIFVLVGTFIIILGEQLRRAFIRADRLAVEYQNALETAEGHRDQLADSEAFLRSVLASSSDCIKVLDLEGRLTFMSEGGQQVMEVSDFGAIEGCPWDSFWEGSGNQSARAAIAAANVGRNSSFTDQAATMAGNMRWWDVAVTPILDSAGQPERILSVSRDVTKSRVADEQIKLLNGELGHRLKNILALVQAIASQTLRGDVDPAAARESLSNRLVALGRGADILTASSWESAELGAIARSVLAPHVPEAARLEIAGAPVALASRLALSLTLAFHELATNAVKYGALANDAGKIAIKWEIYEAAGSNERRLRLTWTEMGGPMVAQPTRKGFGSALIGRALSANFRGTSDVTYDPAGIVFVLDAPEAALNEIEQG